MTNCDPNKPHDGMTDYPSEPHTKSGSCLVCQKETPGWTWCCFECWNSRSTTREERAKLAMCLRELETDIAFMMGLFHREGEIPMALHRIDTNVRELAQSLFPTREDKACCTTPSTK